jgi:cyanophycinase-like exopeptidase
VVKGLGIDRETAVVIDPEGKALVIGKNAAYFLRVKTRPEICAPNQPLTFVGTEVFKGTERAQFDLRTWSGSGGETYRVTVEKGQVLSTGKDGRLY